MSRYLGRGSQIGAGQCPSAKQMDRINFSQLDWQNYYLVFLNFENKISVTNMLVTCIEILSPVNKRIPGWQAYHEKRNELHRAGVHFLEIDLLRRGKRHVQNPKLPETDYLFSLWRTGNNQLEIWTNRLKEPLPVLPVPLLSPDPDVLLPLKTALDMIYQRGLYNLSIDYSESPAPPDLSEELIEWMRTLV